VVQHRILVANPAKLYGFELKVASAMSVNNKRVFYVKYLAHPIFADAGGAAPRPSRPAETKAPRKSGADPNPGARHQIGAARRIRRPPTSMPTCCAARRTLIAPATAPAAIPSMSGMHRGSVPVVNHPARAHSVAEHALGMM
jgi:D-3-phosphoglycerate dehydrogenase